MVETKLRKWGNSIGAILPKKKLEELGLKEGDKIEINIITKRKLDGFGISKGAKPFKEKFKDRKEFW